MKAQACLVQLYDKLKDVPDLELETNLINLSGVFDMAVPPFMRIASNPVQYNQINFIYKGKRFGDAICYQGSYGYPDLLEIMGEDLISPDETDDTVLGYLTANDVANRVFKAINRFKEVEDWNFAHFSQTKNQR